MYKMMENEVGTLLIRPDLGLTPLQLVIKKGRDTLVVGLSKMYDKK